MLIPVAKRLENLKEYYFSVKRQEIAALNKKGKKIINLGIGSPDLPPHPEVVKVLADTAQKKGVHGYQSYRGAPELRRAFAEWYQKYFRVRPHPEEEILPLIGSKEGIMHLSMTFLNPGDEVLVPNPGYLSYQSATRLAGAKCRLYDLKEEQKWQPDIETLEQHDLSRVKLMWINYPQMPTGAPADPELFKTLIAFAKRHKILLCHDNPYSFIQPSTPRQKLRPHSIWQLTGGKEVAVELNSLSKSHNMAGWRIGMLLGKAAIIKQVLRYKSQMDSGMFLPLQLAAAKALQLNEEWYQSLNHTYQQRRIKANRLLDLLNCHYQTPQQGLFIWAKIPKQFKDGYALSDFCLKQARIFMTPGGIFGDNGKNYIRVSLCSSLSQFDEAIERLTTALEAFNPLNEIAS